MKQTKSFTKRLLATMLSLAMVFSLVQANIYSASAEISGDYEYNTLSDDTVEIIGYNGTDTDIEIPKELDGKTVTSIGERAFYIKDITSVVIPDTVTNIDAVAFAYCDKLTRVEIPDSVTQICSEAFRGCRKLPTVKIPSSVTSIGEDSFEDCAALQSFVVDANNKNYSSEDGVLFNKDKTTLIQYPIGKVDTAYTIPNTVKSVATYAFEYSSILTSITVSSNVKSISSSALNGCFSLKSINVSSKNTNFSSDNGVLYNKDKTELIKFPTGIATKTYTIPSGVKKIGDCAFSYCESLVSIVIPKGVTSIGNIAFFMCSSLKNVTIPNSVVNIDRYAFSDCGLLKNVNYLGTKEQWNKTKIDEGNENLTKATINFCEHTSTKVVNKKSTTYFAKGYSGDTTCKTCGTLIKKGKATAKKTLRKPTVKVTPGKKQFNVKYTKVSGATGFQVQYKVGKKTITKTFSTMKSATKSIKKLAKGTYKVKVRAFVKQGKNKAYSSWTKTKTIIIK